MRPRQLSCPRRSVPPFASSLGHHPVTATVRLLIDLHAAGNRSRKI
jgi:hypothetical protein